MKVDYRIVLSALLMCWARPVAAQQVLFQGVVATDTATQTVGPNRAYFSHLYVGYQSVVGRGTAAAPVTSFGSGELRVGWRQKWRLTQVGALGLDVSYARLNFLLRQRTTKTIPTAALFDRESLSWQQVQLAPFLRLNAGRRGNVVGNYLDVGAWGSWSVGTSHTTKTTPGNPARVVRTTERGLPYAARWGYGAAARLGTGRYAVVAHRRLSSNWRGAAAADWAQLPRWSVGLELGLL